MTKSKASQSAEMKNKGKLPAGVTKTKTTQGRQKIKIEKIANVNNRQVTFSKRRGGLFKKAAEICILTGARVALIVQSAGKRVYSFGYPDIDTVIAGYQSGYEIPPQPWTEAELHQMKLHNDDYNRLCLELEAEKKKLAALENAGNGSGSGSEIPWFEKPLDGMSLEELLEILTPLEELKKNVENTLNDVHTSQPLALAITNNSVDHHDLSQRFEITNDVSDYFSQPMETMTMASDQSNQPLPLTYNIDSSQSEAITTTPGNVSSYIHGFSQPMNTMNNANVDLSLMFNVDSIQTEVVTNTTFEIGNEVDGDGIDIDDYLNYQF